MDVARPTVGNIIINSETGFFYLILVFTVLAIFFAKNLTRTRAGRAFVAVRDNDLAAEVLGINLAYYKLLAFFIACAFAGLAQGILSFSRH